MTDAQNIKAARAHALSARIVQSLTAAGFTAVSKPNNLLNRTLSGPHGGYWTTITSNASYEGVATMMRDAGYERDMYKRVWKMRGQPAFKLERSGNGCTLFV